MMMKGKLFNSINELLHNFSIDDLVARYYSGELFFFLQKTGEYEKLTKRQLTIRITTKQPHIQPIERKSFVKKSDKRTLYQIILFERQPLC